MIREYYEKFHANISDELNEIDKFLGRHNLPSDSRRNTNYKCTKCKEFEFIINIPTKKRKVPALNYSKL